MPTSGNTAGEAEDFLVFYSSLSFFPCEEIFSIRLQALFDSLKNKFACKNIFCLWFAIYSVYHKEVL